MNYKIEVTGPELILIGEALDLLPHGKVQKLVVKVQAQITEQDTTSAAMVAVSERVTVAPIGASSKRKRKN